MSESKHYMFREWSKNDENYDNSQGHWKTDSRNRKND